LCWASDQSFRFEFREVIVVEIISDWDVGRPSVGPSRSRRSITPAIGVVIILVERLNPRSGLIGELDLPRHDRTISYTF